MKRLDGVMIQVWGRVGDRVGDQFRGRAVELVRNMVLALVQTRVWNLVVYRVWYQAKDWIRSDT